MTASAFYYFASPYHGTAEQMQFRLRENIRATATLLKSGIYVFSPIMYCQELLRELQLQEVEDRRKTIVPYDLAFLHASKGMILYTIEGWKNSWGVDVEIRECQEHKIPIYTLSPEQLNNADFAQLLSQPTDISTLKAA